MNKITVGNRPCLGINDVEYYEKKVLTVMVSNSTNINKTNNHL